MRARALALISANADAGLRGEVEQQRRPRPEFLYLESVHGVDLLDWSQLRPLPRGRSQATSVRHALAALGRLRRYDVVFSDGEHIGIPLALALRALHIDIPHLVLGHHLTTPRKRQYFRLLRASRGMSRVLVHSRLQAELAARELRLPRSAMAVVPYFVDTHFWTSEGPPRRNHVVAVGREHRDYATLAAACSGLPVRVSVAAASLHSPAATWSRPERWPDNFVVEAALDPARLRPRYSEAAIAVIPVLETDFQAGVTSVLEAMSVGRPVITTATAGRSEVIEDGVNGLLVPPGDAAALREAIGSLLAEPARRERMGRAARRTVVEAYRVDLYGDLLAAHLDELAAGRPLRTAPVAVTAP